MSSPAGENTPCRHGGDCGGCSLRSVPYSQQLELKKTAIAQALAEVFQGEINVVPAPLLDYYRNKMEFSFSRQPVPRPKGSEAPLEFEFRFGQKARSRWDRVFDLEQCFLMSPETEKVVAAVRNWALSEKLEYYDLRRHNGCLRHLLLREGKNTGEKMAVLFSSDGKFPRESFVNAVCGVWPDCAVISAVNSSLSDIARSADIQPLSGGAFIKEKLFVDGGPGRREVTFRLSHASFFQTNTLAAQLLYSAVRKKVSELAPQRLFDVYGGAGGFSLACCDIARSCVCIEDVSAAIEDGKVNALENGASNVEFVCAKAEDYLPGAVAGMSGSVVVTDPPRCGMYPRALKAVCEARPPEIIYVSCNPATLARDLKALSQSYKINTVEGFDLFPHTPHVETLAWMSLKT